MKLWPLDRKMYSLKKDEKHIVGMLCPNQDHLLLFFNLINSIPIKPALSRKEFDDFFKLFPEPFFNNRGLIPVDMIVENIKKCIKTDKIMCF
jgi:hypothetical protein